MNSENYYNTIAKDYRNISRRREKYLKKVDSLILSHNKTNVIDYMDVGSGDGIRALKLAEEMNVINLQLVDNSEIINLFNLGSSDIEVNKCLTAIKDINLKKKFNLITCLWNVLGHVGNFQERLLSLKALREHLSAEGSIIIDVNNRYNIKEYGFNSVQINLTNDLNKIENAGYFVLEHDDCKTEVFIHSPFELKELCDVVGLKIEKEIYINYSTGEIENSIFEGQLFYILKHK